MTDQAVWNRLITLHPHVYHPLPCGFHAEGAVLRGVAVRLGLAFPSWSPATTPLDDCDPAARVDSDRVATFGPVPRAASPTVAVVHGAGGNKYVARAVAQKLAS